MRQEGYYWVKDQIEWCIAEWWAGSWWNTPEGKKAEEQDFSEIDENRIERLPRINTDDLKALCINAHTKQT